MSLTKLAVNRLMSERKQLSKCSSPLIKANLESENLEKLDVTLLGPEDSLYKGKKFQLRFTFPSNYPLENPMVIFLQPNHIYSNGHICLSVIYKQHWTPAMTIESICLSIISMLASATQIERPPNDSSYVSRAPSDPRSSNWIFEDDKC
ncbi:MAG: putative ubiquitin-conjugating enzyme [Streblomastix strix]|uniref:Putative ubiquitin-conjugating enzyme n=1 Tax=Streblomastix strix TaxID=222440 RepID=A0A5J4US09_9EUKA|nr:MAG: putative ubiquitin-conjugating enzyme [Streblomastix strix]